MKSGVRSGKRPGKTIPYLVAFIFGIALYSGCAEEKLPADPPSDTGTIIISVGAV